jgi:hypothetical protein
MKGGERVDFRELEAGIESIFIPSDELASPSGHGFAIPSIIQEVFLYREASGDDLVAAGTRQYGFQAIITDSTGRMCSRMGCHSGRDPPQRGKGATRLRFQLEIILSNGSDGTR